MSGIPAKSTARAERLSPCSRGVRCLRGEVCRLRRRRGDSSLAGAASSNGPLFGGREVGSELTRIGSSEPGKFSLLMISADQLRVYFSIEFGIRIGIECGT